MIYDSRHVWCGFQRPHIVRRQLGLCGEEEGHYCLVWGTSEALYSIYVTVCVCEILSLNKVNQIFVPFLFLVYHHFPDCIIMCILHLALNSEGLRLCAYNGLQVCFCT